MRQAVSAVAKTVLVVLCLDLLILFASLGQIAIEGRTGYWNPFWHWQAEQVVRVLR